MSDESPAVSPTGAPLISPRFVPLLLTLSLGAVAALEVLVSELPAGSRWRVACMALQAALLVLPGVASPGLRRHAGKALAVLLVLGLSVPAMAAPADAPVRAPSVLTPEARLAWEPNGQDCRRWGTSARNWKKAQRWSTVLAGVSGALGAVLALSLKSEEAGAIGGFSAALSGGVAWLSGEQAEDYRRQFDEWCRSPAVVAQ